MGLIWFDGFDDYADEGGDDSLFTSSGYAYAIAGLVNGGVRNFSPHGAGRSYSFRGYTGFDTTSIGRALGYDVADVIVGFHYWVGNRTGDNGPKVVSFNHENGLGKEDGNAQLIINAQRGITVIDTGPTNPNAGIIAISQANLIQPKTWYFIEARLNFITKRLIVRVNEVEVINKVCLAPLDFQTCNMVGFYGFDQVGTDPQKYIDNLYILDAQTGGAPFNNFLGEIVVSTTTPDADAGTNQWALGGSGADPEHYKKVDEMFINDGDYLVADTAGLMEMFSMTNLPADTLEVLAVAACSRAYKSGGGPASIRNLVKVGAGAAAAMTTRPLSSTPGLNMDIMETKPNGGGAWSINDVNALQLGFEAVA